jgi:hypothetical protein
MRQARFQGPFRPSLLALSGLLLLLAAACGGGGAAVGTGGAGGADQPWLRATPTWSSIYTVYFGPAGVASCAGASGCHTTLDQAGGVASNFACPDQDGCYSSITGLSHLVRDKDLSAPASAPLLAKLRQSTGSGRMPSSSTFVFQPEDIDVLTQWIAAGAKND